MNKLEQAARQALEALRNYENTLMFLVPSYENKMRQATLAGGSRAIAALREALDHSGEAVDIVQELLAKRPQNCGTGYCSCIECPYEAEQTEQEPSCNQHPDAPHGFARNASHNAGRYVCECEGWEPEQAEQEPVARVIGGVFEPCNDAVLSGAWELYAAPIRTKDLTDDDYAALLKNCRIFKHQAQAVERLIKSKFCKQIDLTDAEIKDIANEHGEFHNQFARAVIAADRRKNGIV